MRALLFVIALATLGWAGADFWHKTRPMLAELPDLRDRVSAQLTDGIGRARALGTSPPRASEVEAARRAAADCLAETAALANRWYSGARSGSDYLQPRAMRPNGETGAALRRRLEELLLSLPVDLKKLPASTPIRLGLLTPSLTRSLDLAAPEFEDQVERAVVASFLADTLRSATAIAIDDVSAIRNGDGQLELRLRATGSLDDVVALGDALVAATDAVPPRRLMQYHLRCLEQAEWSSKSADLASPPLQLEMAIAFCFPSTVGEGAR